MNQLLLSFLNKVIGNNGRPLKKQNEYMFWSPFVSHHKPKLQINIVIRRCWLYDGVVVILSITKKVKFIKSIIKSYPKYSMMIFIPIQKKNHKPKKY